MNLNDYRNEFVVITRENAYKIADMEGFGEEFLPDVNLEDYAGQLFYSYDSLDRWESDPLGPIPDELTQDMEVLEVAGNPDRMWFTPIEEFIEKHLQEC
jgi:hypothetical protein